MAMVIVIGWQVYDIARETMGLKEAAFRLGIIGLVQFVPLFALTLITGWTADRVDRRWIARASLALELACAVALGVLAWRGTTTLVALYAVAALLGVARAFAGPALRALAPNLVPRAILPRAIALSSIAWQIGRDRRARNRRLPLRLVAVRALCRKRGPVRDRLHRPARDRPGRPARRSQRGPSPWAQMVEGLRYVRHNRLVLGAISLDLFAVLLGGATAMLPVFARDVLHAGPEGLGHLRAAPAVGATLTAAVLLVSGRSRYNVGVKDAGRGRRLRHRDDRVRPVALDAAVARLPRPARRRGHVLGLRPPVADPALHARRDARPGRGGVVACSFPRRTSWARPNPVSSAR